jgi:hypothetical protein
MTTLGDVTGQKGCSADRPAKYGVTGGAAGAHRGPDGRGHRQGARSYLLGGPAVEVAEVAALLGELTGRSSRPRQPITLFVLSAWGWRRRE